MSHQNVIFPSDVTGTGVWRMLWPQQALSNIRDIETTIMRRPVLNPNYYTGMNFIMYQRLVATPHRNVFDKIFLPAAKRFGTWLIANLDDCLHPDEIPTYNIGRQAYTSQEAIDNIQYYLDNSDLLITTTDEISNYYINKWNVKPEKIVKIPNYLPEWEFGNFYNERDIMENYVNNKKRPRVGIISSASHYNQDPESPIKDDIDLIIDLIKSTVNDYQWVFLGNLPHKLKPYADKKLIEYHQGVDIYNYPSAVANLKLNCLVAPLINSTFNICKSNIKILEASALGIPFFVQNLPNYSKYTKHTFDNQEDLAIKLKDLFRLNKYDFRNIAKENYEMLNKPHPEGNGWWMSKNLVAWLKIFTIRQNTCHINMQEYMKNLEK